MDPMGVLELCLIYLKLQGSLWDNFPSCVAWNLRETPLKWYTEGPHYGWLLDEWLIPISSWKAGWIMSPWIVWNMLKCKNISCLYTVEKGRRNYCQIVVTWCHSWLSNSSNPSAPSHCTCQCAVASLGEPRDQLFEKDSHGIFYGLVDLPTCTIQINHACR